MNIYIIKHESQEVMKNVSRFAVDKKKKCIKNNGMIQDISKSRERIRWNLYYFGV